MVKVTFSPIEELVVHETVEVGMDDLMRERITPAGNMPLYWCEGILFSFSSLPMTEDVVRDYLKGRVHWLEAHYTKMPQYKPVITMEAEEYKASMSVRVIDTEKSAVHREFVKWLKTKKS